MRNVFEAILECGHDEDFVPRYNWTRGDGSVRFYALPILFARG